MIELAEILIANEVATAAEVERASLHGDAHGGDLAWCLLETSDCPEDLLHSAFAQALGRMPGPAGMLPSPEPLALAKIPGDEALHARVLPARIDGTRLVVYAAEALSATDVSTLAARAGMPVVVRVVLSIRLRHALASVYRLPLDSRSDALLRKLAESAATPEPKRSEVTSNSRIERALIDAPPVSDRATLVSSDELADRASERVAEFSRAIVSAASDSDVLSRCFELLRHTFACAALLRRGRLGAELVRCGSAIAAEARSGPSFALDTPSIFRAATLKKIPLITLMKDDGVDAFFAAAIGHMPQGAVFVAPVMVGAEIVAYFYGDDGDLGVDPAMLDVVTPALNAAGRVLVKLRDEALRKGPARLRSYGAIPRTRPSAPDLRFDLASMQNALIGPKVVPPSVPQLRSALAREEEAVGTAQATPPKAPSGAEPVARSAHQPSSANDVFTPKAAAPGAREEVWKPGPAPSLHAPALDVWRPLTNAPPAPNHPASAVGRPAVPAQRVALPARPHAAVRPNTQLNSAVAPAAPRARDVDVWRPGMEPAAEQPIPEPDPSGAEMWVPGTPMGAATARANGVAPVPAVKPMPEAQSTAAHAPAASRARERAVEHEEASIVIADALEFEDAAARVATGDLTALRELLPLGVRAMPALMAKFPGAFSAEFPLTGALPLAAELSPVVGATVAMGPVAKSYLFAAADDADLGRRLAAVIALSELGEVPLESCMVLAEHEEPRARHIALVLLRRMADGAPRPILDAMARVAGDLEHPPPRRILMMAAMAAMHQPIAVPLLVPMLSDPYAQVALAVARALTTLTGQDFGREGRKWVSWWTANVGRHRIEWLIEGLLNEDEALALRNAAEIERLINARLPDELLATRQGRDRLFGELRTWWQRDGRAKHGGASG